MVITLQPFLCFYLNMYWNNIFFTLVALRDSISILFNTSFSTHREMAGRVLHQSRWHWWRMERTARGRWRLSLGINRAGFILRQLCMMSYSKLSLFTRLIVRSGRCAFSAAHRLSGSFSFSLRVPTLSIVFPIFYHIGIHVTWESFFCEEESRFCVGKWTFCVGKCLFWFGFVEAI